jgi:ATP phosphoribosyltransferase regulatory subunit HisZ
VSVDQCEFKQCNQWFDEECSKLLHTALQRLQKPVHINADNVDNVKYEAGRTFRAEEGNIRKKK